MLNGAFVAFLFVKSVLRADIFRERADCIVHRSVHSGLLTEILLQLWMFMLEARAGFNFSGALALFRGAVGCHCGAVSFSPGRSISS